MRKLIVTAALLVPAAALASGDSVPNVNPRDLALAGSATAAQEGAPAVYGNPAALSRLEGFHLSLAGTVLDNATTWTSTTGIVPSPQSTKFKPAPPPALYAAFGGKLGERGWGAGIGVTIPNGGNVDFDPNWAGRDHIITVDRKVFATFLSGGIEVVPQVRLGASAVWYRTTEYLVQGRDLLGTPVTAELSTAGGALSYGLSAEIRPSLDVPLTIGVDYKHKADQKLTGDARFHGVPEPLRTDPSAQDQGVTHYLTYPNSLNLALAYQVSPRVLLTAGWTLDRWVVYDQDAFNGDAGASVVVQRNYRNGATYRVGGEYTLSPDWKLRAGILYDHTGMDVRYWSPSLPDGNVWAGAVGAGCNLGKGFGLDGTIFYAHYDDVTTATGGDVFPGRWATRAIIYSLGLTYHWNPEGVGQVKMQ
jgi:long-chain fatty acid transport protein